MNFNKEVFINHLAELSNLVGVSGHEEPIAKYLLQQFHQNDLHVQRDALGGVYASTADLTQPKLRKRILIAAHMDEVGFIVNEILANGLLKVTPVGGVVADSLFGMRVACTLHGKKVPGMFTAIPSHFATTQKLSIADLSVDFGFETEEDARTHGMSEGEVVYFDTTFEPTVNPHRYIGKAIDNRYGCAMVATLAHELKDLVANGDVDIVIGATTMEEIGLKGATAAINTVNPDLVIVLDCSPASDTLAQNNKNGRLGAGVLFRYMDRTMVMPERIKKFITTLYQKYEIGFQPYVSAGGTDAGRMMEQQKGIVTITCCIPARYIHNNAAMMDVRDVTEAYKTIYYTVLNYNTDIHNYLQYRMEDA